MATDPHGGCVIETARLRLRRFVGHDLEFLVDLLGDAVTMSHWPAPLGADEAAAWLQRALDSYLEHGFGRWLVVAKDDGRPVGDAGIVVTAIQGRREHDLGYIIHRDHWGHGLGLEAAAGCVEWARERRLGSVVANMADDNSASIRVAEKLGMTLESTFNNPRNAGKLTRLYRLDL